MNARKCASGIVRERVLRVWNKWPPSLPASQLPSLQASKPLSRYADDERGELWEARRLGGQEARTPGGSQPENLGRLGRTRVARQELRRVIEICGRFDAVSEGGLYLTGVEVGDAGFRIDADRVLQQLHRVRRERISQSIARPRRLGRIRSVLRVALRRELEGRQCLAHFPRRREALARLPQRLGIDECGWSECLGGRLRRFAQHRAFAEQRVAANRIGELRVRACGGEKHFLRFVAQRVGRFLVEARWEKSLG